MINPWQPSHLYLDTIHTGVPMINPWQPSHLYLDTTHTGVPMINLWQPSHLYLDTIHTGVPMINPWQPSHLYLCTTHTGVPMINPSQPSHLYLCTTQQTGSYNIQFSQKYRLGHVGTVEYSCYITSPQALILEAFWYYRLFNILPTDATATLSSQHDISK